MKLLPRYPESGMRYNRGFASLKRGAAASFLLIVTGLAGGLAYALASGQSSVWLSPFCAWWIALSSCAGGLLAGMQGGPGVWWPAGQIGVLAGGLVLAALALVAPESLGAGDLLTYGLLPAGLSCAGALAGANLGIRTVRHRPAARRESS